MKHMFVCLLICILSCTLREPLFNGPSLELCWRVKAVGRTGVGRTRPLLLPDYGREIPRVKFRSTDKVSFTLLTNVATAGEFVKFVKGALSSEDIASGMELLESSNSSFSNTSEK